MVLLRYFFITCGLITPLIGQPVRVTVPHQRLMLMNHSLGSEFACSELQSLVIEIQKELGMADYKIEVRKFSEKGLEKNTPGLAFGTTHVFFDEEELLAMSRDEQRFIIGHELIHIRGNHKRKERLLDKCISYGGMALSIVGAVALRNLMLAAKRELFDYDAWSSLCYKGKVPCKELPLFTRDEAFGFSLGACFLGSCTSFLYGSYCEQSFSRSHEEEADCYAAHELHCALGGCLFFLKSMLDNGDFSSESGIFDSHPTTLKRFMNVLMISGDSTLSNLVSQSHDKPADIYFQDILDYLEEQVA